MSPFLLRNLPVLSRFGSSSPLVLFLLTTPPYPLVLFPPTLVKHVFHVRGPQHLGRGLTGEASSLFIAAPHCFITPELHLLSDQCWHNKCNAFESSPNCPLNAPFPRFMEKWSSIKPVSGAKNVGDHCSYTAPVNEWQGLCFRVRTEP